MSERIVELLMFLGAAFMLLAGIGCLRLPDLYTRNSALSKAVSLGVGFLGLALCLHFRTAGVSARAALVVIFFFVTSPISSHMIARAGLLKGVRLWSGSVVDEWSGSVQREEEPRD